jgi:hypothetical protein
MLRIHHAINEYANEPFERVLIHGINLLQVQQTEKQNLCAIRHWNI